MSGRSAARSALARSDALQNRNRTKLRAWNDPGSAEQRFALHRVREKYKGGGQDKSGAGSPPPHPFFTSHNPSMAPVGSVIMLKVPAPITSVTSFITWAPSVLALAVAARTSSTST